MKEPKSKHITIDLAPLSRRLVRWCDVEAWILRRAEIELLEIIAKKRKLPTLSDGKPRYVSPAQYASLVTRAKAAGKPLREWLELGGCLEKKGKV